MADTVSVLLVGCGAPKRSMGWYHAEQLIAGRCPSAKLQYIVEPFYMNDSISKGAPGYDEFHQWKQETQTKHGVRFFATAQEVPAVGDDDKLRMGIIASRTADNPALFDACVVDCGVIYLEKPGAPSVSELQAMQIKAIQHKTKVYMGFNKNVSSYLTKTREFAAKLESPADVTFVHNNAYDKNDLAECFERNSEGMLKNMAIHELAILATFYGVAVETISSVTADKEFSSCQTLVGPSSGRVFTDFDKLKFKITTKSGKGANIAADRCGGDDSVGIVTDSATGKVLARYSMPDESTVANIPHLETLYLGSMPYFFTQDPDYCTLKERVAKAYVQSSEPDGVATIETAIQSLLLAEYLTPLLQYQLSE
jgi:predicted dehydrogenase